MKIKAKDNLRDIMKLIPISNKELAENVGVGSGYISQILGAKVNISPKTARAICKATKQKFENIFSVEE